MKEEDSYNSKKKKKKKMLYGKSAKAFVLIVKVYSLLLCGLFYEAICFMSYLVSFCSYVFQSF